MVRFNRSAAMGVMAALAAALTVGCRPGPPTLKDISSVDELAARFNADAGKPRIILLLSPT